MVIDMWTQDYKGFLVQGYVDKEACSVVGVTGVNGSHLTNTTIKFKSFLAAKQAISKWINKGYPLPKYVL